MTPCAAFAARSGSKCSGVGSSATCGGPTAGPTPTAARLKRCRRSRGTPSVDPAAQAKTDWTPVRVPGHEKAYGPETQFAWFAYNNSTKESIEFGSFEEARDFCLQPENARQPEIKAPRPGDRVRLISMRHDPDPLDPGQLGTVVSVRRHGAGADEWHQIDVAWDNGRSLMLVSPPDEFEIVGRG